MHYPIHKLKLLVLKWPITEKFRDYLYWARFEVWMDNNPLTYVLTSAKVDAMGHKWVVALADYKFSIYYCAGRHSMDADALSRWPHGSETEVISVDGMRGICNHSGMGTLPSGSPPECTAEMLCLPVESVPQLSINYVLEQPPLPRLGAAG